ncbi:competence type IV pilus minor pilin ComGF [Jeotgalibacillus sp. S-D1]|uniref:competence type IV pilus minor pilin ComGF n=1 Tax=Jeotgalibacillus sp. S-D1 TaxID=2552189 RepID=UPI001404EB10|nr:competence type IV pilus minor pilin ComGF [Jeotgalibacillus sp. S-D1]
MKHDQKRRRHVFPDSNGFTLIEVIICLTILMIVASLMPLMIVSIHSAHNQIEANNEPQWDLFIIQFRNEVKLHEIQKVEPQKLTLKSTDGNVISFSKYETLLRRQVNGAGHEIYLTALKGINFSISNEMLSLEVTFSDGTKKEARFIDNHAKSAGKYNASRSPAVHSDFIFGRTPAHLKPPTNRSL